MKFLWLLTALVGCVDDASTTPFSITPADGQTDVGVFEPLLVRGTLVYPADAELPESIQVIDTTEGVFVEGELAVTEEGLSFEAATAWELDRTYLWTVSNPPLNVRQPGLTLPDSVLGSAFFTPRSGPQLLEVSDTAVGTCLLWSQPILSSTLESLEVAIGEVQLFPFERRLLTPAEFDSGTGLGGACLGIQGVDPGAELRFTSGERSWNLQVSGAPLEDLARERRRMSL